MTFCCVTFPPTRNFEEWLRKHLWEHTKLSDSRQASYARFCVRKLDLICEAPPSARVPSYHEIEMMKVQWPVPLIDGDRFRSCGR